MPVPGDLLLGKLRVTRELGRGGMGQVFEVLHEFTRHRRALKLLHAAHQADQETVQRFLREASAAGRIGNAHIAETFDAGYLPDGSAFLLMELLDGVSLRTYLHSLKRLDLPEAAAIVRQCCEALQAAHEAGIVHRDIKPDNLFLTGPQQRFVKVLDFGVARFQDADEPSQGVVGTPLYMAPEQLTGAAVAPPTDLYALGVVLFELVAGTLPWATGTVHEVLERVASGQLPSLQETLPDVDPAFAGIVPAAWPSSPRSGTRAPWSCIARSSAGPTPRPWRPPKRQRA